MAHIALNNEQLPGIVGLLDFSPRTAKPLLGLANALLSSESTLSKGDREVIAASVSWWNDCHFCHSSHGATAVAHYQADVSLIDDIKVGLPAHGVTPKLKALLQIARQVQQGGKHVTPEDVAAARAEGATDQEIHDTVLISAAFCMYNRYVDGLGTWAPRDNEAYLPMGQDLATNGYRVREPAGV